jgi:hypothetical protein
VSLAAIQQLVTNLVRDDNEKVTETQRDEAIALALEAYSVDRPRTKVVDVTHAAGGKSLALAAGWQAGFSTLKSLEYPVGSIPPEVIKTGDYALYQGPSEEVIHLVDGLPVNAVVRHTFTIRHELTASLDTVPDRDRQAFAYLAAAIVCDQLAALYANNSDSTIQADTVDHKSQSDQYRATARHYRTQYKAALGLGDQRAAPSGVVVQLDRDNSHGGDRFFRRSKQA